MAGEFDNVAQAVRVRRVDASGADANTVATQAVTNTGAASAAVTLTIPAPGAGLSIYLDELQVVAYATAAMAGGASPAVVATTNLPGGLALTLPTNLAIGQAAEQKLESALPLKASAPATAVTVVAPALTSAIWRINAIYHVAP